MNTIQKLITPEQVLLEVPARYLNDQVGTGDEGCSYER